MSILSGLGKTIIAVIAAGMLTAPTAISAPKDFAPVNDGSYYYRYKGGAGGVEPTNPTNPIVSKDIVAWYIGGVGLPFSEILPIKPEWQGLTWRVVKGTLPDGITFDNPTRTFSGVPEKEQRDHVVEMIGYAADGSEEATAEINFEIIDMLGHGQQVTLYAHTGKYKYDELPIPSGLTIDNWEADPIRTLPPGISVDGPYFQGIPTQAGRYPIIITGKDYMGDVLATYLVTYVVEDGPSFPVIPDDIRTLKPSGTPSWVWSGYFDFGAPSTYKVNYAIDPSKNVRYFLRIADENASLPGKVKSNSDPLNLRLVGFVTEPYDTVRAYFHAIDSDGTSGDSNTFEFGTGDPTPVCREYPYAPEYISFVTGKDIKTQLALPFGNQGTVKYTLTSGTLPEGLSLEDGGRIVGVTKTTQPKSDISVRIEVINEQSTLTADCNYTIEVVNQKLKLFDSTSAQNQHGRVGAPYSGSVSVQGSIPDFSIDWTAGVQHPTLQAPMPAENQTTVPVTGTFEKAGLPVSYSFTIVNGDTNTAAGDLDLYGYKPLAFGDPRTFIPNYTVKRLDYGVWGKIPYDVESVVPDTSGNTSMPLLVLGSSNMLPGGVVFDGRKFGGMTQESAGQYGPFRINMSDFTGESLESDMFYLNVEPRAPNVITAAPDQVFLVEQSASQRGAQPVVQHPAGALGFTRTWSISGPALPPWATFDPATGTVTAAAGIPYGDLEQPANKTVYGPYSLTVTDNDPLEPSTSEPSAPFNIVLTDMPAPSASQMPKVEGTVSGDATDGLRSALKSMIGLQSAQQKTITTIKADGFNQKIDPKTIIGTVDEVVFTHSEPDRPAGVPLQISADGHAAWFDGSPTEAFTGSVKVFFKDIRGRTGFVSQPMEVKPYPTVTMTASSYDLPRLAPAADYAIQPNGCPDCWSPPKWSVDPAGVQLPPGLEISPGTGVISGFTEELDDQTPGTRSPFAGIVLKAVSKGANGEELVTWTDPFQINIKPRVAMTLEFPTGKDVWYLNDKTPSTSYTFNKRTISAPKVGGSHRPTVTFEADSSSLLPSQGFNSTTGILSWNLNNLTLGSWSTLVTARDAEGQEAFKTLDVKATLFGDVTFVSGGGKLRLRQSESFMTGNPLMSTRYAEPIVVKDVVGSMTYEKASGPSTVTVMPSGEFLEGSRIDNKGSYAISITGRDSDDRKIGSGPVQYFIEIVPPLAFQPGITTPFTGRQYSAEEPIEASFPAIDNVMDTLEFEVTSADGNPLPGTIVYKVYDANGAFAHWQWTNTDGSGNVVAANDPVWKSKLPLDALVFDPADRSLRGIPSKDGTFNIRLTAIDTYRNSYLHQDDVNYPLEKRIENNKATYDIVVEVAPALPLEIVNRVGSVETSTEQLAQYTKPASMRGVVKNAAYGLPLAWTSTSGQLPKGLLVIPSAIDLTFTGYAEEKGTFGNIRYTGVDRAGRPITNDPATFVVGDRETFELVASANPKQMAVFLTDADLTVSPKNHAFGRNIGKDNWTISGQSNLPPGVSMTVNDRVVRFSGKSPKIGTYGPVTISAPDALGAQASVSLTFEVRIPDGAIILDVADIKTKQTYPFQMQASASNTYGTVRFYSYGLTGTYGANMSLNEATGFVEGNFAEPTRFSVDTYVTDETNRVTSKPVSVEVLPFVRVTVPATVKATETVPMTQSVTTDYALGTLTYEKGAGNWPDGLTVDPNTGTISGKTVKSEPGTYAGLTIRVTDTFKDYNGKTYQDVQDSNVFEIALDGIPDISDVNSTATNRAMLYTKDVAATSWKPTVIDKITKKAWNLPGTVYSLNKDFEFETGLTFDPTTGEISGTPTKLIVYTDLAITVTSPHGNTDTTKPFWFAVQPQGSIWAQAGQPTQYNNRVGTLLDTNAPIFENTVGEVTYTATGLPTGMALDPITGVVSGTPTVAGISNVVVTAKDGASRTANLSYKIDNRGVLAFTLAKPTLGINIGETYTALNLPVTSNVGGSATYYADGLPLGLSLNPTNGSLVGSPDATIANDTKFEVTVKVEDSFDGDEETITYVLTVALPIDPAPGQKTEYNLRRGEAWTTAAPVFTNAVGSLTYSIEARSTSQSDWPLVNTTGYAVDPSTGVISGNPELASYVAGSGLGRYTRSPGATNSAIGSIILTATDAVGRTGTITYQVRLLPEFAITLPSPTLGLVFDTTYTTLNKPTVANLGGTARFTASGLPMGLSVDPGTGAIRGSVADGTYPVGTAFNVVVTGTDDYDGATSNVSYTLTVAAPFAAAPNQKTAYAIRVGDTLTVDLPKFENAFGDVTYTQSGKPSWLSFSATDGSASGTAAFTSVGTVTVTATDAINRKATFTYTVTTRAVMGLTVAPIVDGLDFGRTLINANRPSMANIFGTASFEDVGGVLASMGLAMSKDTGAISGSISGSIAHGDTFNPVIRLRDSYDDLRKQLVDSGNVATPANDATPFHRDVTYRLTATRPITAVAGQKASYAVRVGDTLTVDLPAFNDTVGNLTFTQSGKPSWLSFSETNGRANGTSTFHSNNTVTVTVKDSTLRTASLSYTITSRQPLSLEKGTIVEGMDLGTVYPANTNRPVVSNVGNVATFEDVGGVLGSTGFVFDTTTGGFSGQIGNGMTVGQKVSANVRVTDSYDDLRLQLVDSGNVIVPAADTTPRYREISYDITVTNPMTIAPGAVTTFVARDGDALRINPFLVNNAAGAVTYSTSVMPSSFKIDASTGIVTGTMNGFGTWAWTLTAQDETQRSVSQIYRMTYSPKLVMAISGPVTEVLQSVGRPYTNVNRPTVTGIVGTASYAVSGLPPEFTYAGTTGSISGTVAKGIYPDGTTFPIKVVVTDSFDGRTKDLDYTLVMKAAPAPNISITPVSTGYAATSTAVIPTVIGNGKQGDLVALAPGSSPLPPGFTLTTNASTGAWSLTKTATTDNDTGVYKGINLRITDVDGAFGETGPFDIILRTSSFLSYPTQIVEARADVPLVAAAPTPSVGKPLADLKFSFSTDVTGGTLSIDQKTGVISGTFNKAGTNVVSVVEGYDGKVIRSFSYSVTLKVVQLSVTVADFAVIAGIEAEMYPTVAYAHASATFALTGSVPQGLVIDQATGKIGGTPVVPGVYNVNLVYTDNFAMISRPVKVTVLGNSATGHRFWRAEVTSSNPAGSFSSGNLFEVEIFDSGNNNVTRLATKSGDPSLFDSVYTTGISIGKAVALNFDMAFPTKIQMSKASVYVKSGGTNPAVIYLTYYWSDDGVTWTKAGGTTTVPTASVQPTSVTTTLSN